MNAAARIASELSRPFYLDGERVETTGLISQSESPTFIGQYVNGKYKTAGTVDEVRVWSRALSAAAVAGRRVNKCERVAGE